MASVTDFECVGVAQDFKDASGVGPAKVMVKHQDGTFTEARIWPQLKDFRTKPPTESVNPAYIAAQASEGGKWTGYSKMETWVGDDGTDYAERRWYLTDYEPEGWTEADNQPIAVWPDPAMLPGTPPTVQQFSPPVSNGKISSYALGSAARIVAGLASAGKVDVEGALGLWLELSERAEEAIR